MDSLTCVLDGFEPQMCQVMRSTYGPLRAKQYCHLPQYLTSESPPPPNPQCWRTFRIPNSLDLVYVEYMLVHTWTSNFIVVWAGVVCCCNNVRIFRSHVGMNVQYFCICSVHTWDENLGMQVLPATPPVASIKPTRPSILVYNFAVRATFSLHSCRTSAFMAEVFGDMIQIQEI